MMSNNLISVEQLQHIHKQNNLIILDGSWYLPNQNRSAKSEFELAHIENAQFFDIDAVSDPKSDLPHMVPSKAQFEDALGHLGISNADKVVVYDGAGLFSAARVWWLFRLFGHHDVLVLNGGLPAWQDAGYPVTDHITEVQPGHFQAQVDNSLIADMQCMRQNCETQNAVVLDARSEGRFAGRDAEPRVGLPSGHIPGATSLAFQRLLKDNQMQSNNSLMSIFKQLGLNRESQIITSCGSGVTAAIITLALDQCGFGMQQLYDGSWTEWASHPDNPIVGSA